MTEIISLSFILSVDYVQLGFLPRNVAQWVSPLWDAAFFRFSGYICPKEALAAALGENCKTVQLILYVSEVLAWLCLPIGCNIGILLCAKMT